MKKSTITVVALLTTLSLAAIVPTTYASRTLGHHGYVYTTNTRSPGLITRTGNVVGGAATAVVTGATNVTNAVVSGATGVVNRTGNIVLRGGTRTGAPAARQAYRQSKRQQR